MNKEKDLRMVFWVPYNISEIQKGIQAGHCALEYVVKCFKTLQWKKLWEFITTYKTWMVFNGGTTNCKLSDNNKINEYTLKVGSLNNIVNTLNDFEIPCSVFCEPDLNDAVTAVCCIIDYNEIDFESNDFELASNHDDLSIFIREQRFA